MAHSTPPTQQAPTFNSKQINCIICGKEMFYSEENLVHVCLEEGHGVLCFFEPDSCWFAASEETSLELARRGIKFHFIPKKVFENAEFEQEMQNFECEYKAGEK